MLRLCFFKLPLILLFVSSCTLKSVPRTPSSTPADEVARLEGKSDGEYERMFMPLSPEKTLTYSKLKDVLTTGDHKSIPSALKALSEKFPEYLTFHTYMYDSRSLHGSTYANPRAIVFGPQAQMVFTFNGHVKQKRGSSIETMEYSEADKKFNFREILFKQPNVAHDYKPEEIEFENKNLLISKPNTFRCADCHTANYANNLQPIFAPYFVWPGAYGSNDDDLTMSSFSYDAMSYQFPDASVKQATSLKREIQLKDSKNDTELTEYNKFLKNKNKHVRYKWLPTRPADLSLIAAQNGKTELSPEQFAQVSGDMAQSQEWPIRPNLYLDSQLNRLTYLSLMAELKRLKLDGFFKNHQFQNRMKEFDIYPMGEAGLTSIVDRYHAYLNTIEFLGSRPSKTELRELLLKELRLAFQIQKRNISRHVSHFPASALQFKNYSSDRSQYYSLNLLALAGGSADSVIDRMVIRDLNRVLPLTLINVVLRDRGVDLKHYSLTQFKQTLLFSDGNTVVHMGRILAYLGFTESY